jgi:hypothetical protein
MIRTFIQEHKITVGPNRRFECRVITPPAALSSDSPPPNVRLIGFISQPIGARNLVFAGEIERDERQLDLLALAGLSD